MNRSTLYARLILLAFFLILMSNHVSRGETMQYDIILSEHHLLNGYHQALHGETIDYVSPSPDHRKALLVRAMDGKSFIEWQTEPVNIAGDQQTVHFIWLAGLGCNLGVKEFFVDIDSAPRFTFRVTTLREWQVTDKEGATLNFKSIMEDQVGDLFGFMTLTLPVKAVRRGQPVTIKVTGEGANSRVWYMAFMGGIKERVTMTPGCMLIKEDDRFYQPLAMNVIYLGPPARATIQADGCELVTIGLTTGFNRATLNFPRIEAAKTVSVRMDIGDRQVFSQSIDLTPVRPWTIYLTQHTHTDIGYTRPQTEILAEHVRFIDYALDYCDLTDDYPDDAKFRWTCEASWPVREYLTSRPPAQIERLRRRVAEGRIDLTALMFNMSEIPDENILTAFVQPVNQLQQQGLPVRTAMQNDVNGIAWCLADYFRNTGVEYLIMGQHGHRALAPFKLPTAFWWESPAGNRLLAFRAEHYMTGNLWGVHTDNITNVENELSIYLQNLSGRGYPYNEIAIQYSGYTTDNSPPSITPCSLIKRWNEKYEWPKLRSATAHEFMDFIKKNHSDELASYRAAWPDWWTDGAGSAARETAAVRTTQSEMTANLGLLAMAEMLGARLPDVMQSKSDAVQDALLFYDEHTYGAAESITDPFAKNSMVQWAEKASYAWEAVKSSRLLQEAGMGFIQPYLAQMEQPTITLFNTLNWPRSGLHTLYIDHELIPADKAFRILNAAGEPAPVQYQSHRMDGTYWSLWVSDIPAMGYETFRIVVDAEMRVSESKSTFINNTLENPYYRLVFNAEKGTIREWYDKELQRNLLEDGVEWEMGQFIYETLGNRAQLEGFRLDDYRRTTLREASIQAGNDGDIWQSVLITGKLDGCDETVNVQCEVRLYKPVKRLEMVYTIRKLAVIDPEGLYVAFPFSLSGGKIVYEAQGGAVTPGENQLPGSSGDWHTVQNFAAVRGNEGQILLCSDEIPLMHFGDINLGKFQYVAQVESPRIYSWVLNNYWTTNFKASQEGELSWRYIMTSSADRSAGYASRFGWGVRVPFLSRVLPGGKAEQRPALYSLMSPQPSNILLVGARPSRDGQGIILHFREVEGREQTIIDLQKTLEQSVYKTCRTVDVFEKAYAQASSTFSFAPYEVKFVKLE